MHFTYISFGTVKLLRSVHSLKNLTNNGLVPGQRTTTLRISLHLSLLKDQNPRDQKKSQIISTSGKATLSIYNIYNRNIKRLVLPIRIVKSNVSSVIGGDPIHQNSPKCKGGTPFTKIQRYYQRYPCFPLDFTFSISTSSTYTNLSIFQFKSEHCLRSTLCLFHLSI